MDALERRAGGCWRQCCCDGGGGGSDDDPFCSLSIKLNSGNSATACLNRLANTLKDHTGITAAAAWVMAVGGAGGIPADDAWQIIGCVGTGGSSSASVCRYLHEEGGSWAHVMSSCLLSGGPDAAADATLANRLVAE